MIPPIYRPPYDSPIENKFAYNFVKYAAQDCSLIKQYPVDTICGKFIVDFVVIANNGKRIGVECDGKDFHDTSRDEWRDAMILGDDYLDVMYRIKGDDINYQIEIVLFLMAKVDSYMFTDCGRTNLNTLASTKSPKRCENFNPNSPSAVIQIEDSENLHCVLLERRNMDLSSGERKFWVSAYKFASSIGGGNLDEVISKYRNQV